MIIACPACSTRYTVPNDAVSTEGRVVRCAKCRHSWFQAGPESGESPAPPSQPPSELAPTAAAPANGHTTPAIDPTSEIRPSPTIEPSPPGRDADPPPPPEFAETPPTFAYEPPFRPRRNRARWWIVAAILLALVACAVIAGVAEFGTPDWLPLPRNTFARVQSDLVLDFPKNRQQRRPLPNGSDFFNVSGTILNTGKRRRAVPMLLIVLRDAHKNIVYSLETAPPKPVLAPGESATINQAIIDAPSSARSAEIGWKPR